MRGQRKIAAFRVDFSHALGCLTRDLGLEFVSVQKHDQRFSKSCHEHPYLRRDTLLLRDKHRDGVEPTPIGENHARQRTSRQKVIVLEPCHVAEQGERTHGRNEGIQARRVRMAHRGREASLESRVEHARCEPCHRHGPILPSDNLQFWPVFCGTENSRVERARFGSRARGSRLHGLEGGRQPEDDTSPLGHKY